MRKDQTAVFTMMVDNEFGVLTRITALIRRAGWNIRSLSVAETEKPEISRLTICLECKNNTLEFVLEKLGNQSCVREISLFSKEDQVALELAIMRVRRDGSPESGELFVGCDVRTLFENEDERVLSIVCEPRRMDELLFELRKSGPIEVARTGTATLRLTRKNGEAN